MLDKLITEATDLDFKVALEVKKPKSWLKSVGTFANGIGGVLLFSVDDERKIISETEKLPGYTDALRPEFHSTAADFRVVIKNVNFNMASEGQDESQDEGQVGGQVDGLKDTFDALTEFCSVPRSRAEMMALTPIKSVTYFRKTYLLPMLRDGVLKMTNPEKPNSKNQKYIRSDG